MVPAGAVYPATQLNARGVYESTAAGVAVGTTFDEVVRAGTLSALAYQAMHRFASGSAAAFSLDAGRLRCLDPELDYLFKLTDRMGRTPRLYALGGTDSLSVVMATDPSAGHPRYAAGYSLAEAARQALLELVGQLQDHNLYTSADLPWFAQNPQPSFHASLPDERYDRAHSFQQACEGVFSAGGDLLYFNLTPADVMRDGWLIAGRVLIVNP